MSQPLVPDRDLLQQLESMREKISEEQKITQDVYMLSRPRDSKNVDRLLDHLTDVARSISRDIYKNSNEIFELAKTGTYPRQVNELAESFGMMIVKVEARELRLQQTIDKLKKLNEQLQNEYEKHSQIERELQRHRDNLEILIKERTDELTDANKLLKVEIEERKQLEEESKKLVEELQQALDNIQTLKGLIPICSSCRRIRDDSGYWIELKSYISKYAEVEFSQSLCPNCLQELYPKEYKQLKTKGQIS
jgi:chromosome segregation ATPase